MLAVAAVLATLAGCDLRLDATQLTIDFENTGLVLVKVANAPPGYADRKEVPPGETVITVINRDFHHDHAVMLAKTWAAPGALPGRMLRALSPSDDQQEVLELSQPIDHDRFTTAGGAIVEDVKSTQFHDYLAAGQRYLLLDPRLVHAGFYLALLPRAAP